MTGKNGSILIVDDSPEDIRVLLEQLKDQYSVTAAISPEKAFDALQKNKPDLIILDVIMPDMSGYEVCKKLKDSPDTKDIDILFLSANDSTEEVIKGYDLGAIDYIVKPYLPEVLTSKIAKAMAMHRERQSLSNAADSAVKVAMTAMTDSGDLGLLLKFMRNAFSAKTADLLADEVAECLGSFSVDAVVLLKRAGIESFRSSSANELSTIEVELLSRMHGYKDRLLEKGKSLFVCLENTTLLIKKMPEDPEKCGRYRDYFLMLAEGANARLDNIAETMKMDVKRELSLKNVVLEAEESLREIQQMQLEHKKTSVQILDDMVLDVEQSFFPMGLTDTQEQQLLDLLHSAVEKKLEHFEKGVQIDGKVKQIIDSLSGIRNMFH